MVTVAVMTSSGLVVMSPEGVRKGEPTIPETLGKWDKNSRGFWSLNTALLLGLSGTKNGPFEILTFGFKPSDCKVVLRGQVLGVTLYDEPDRKRKLAAVYASGEGCLWQFTCQRELLTPAAVYFIPMPSGVSPQNFNHPHGHDFGLENFCETKEVSVNGGEVGRPEVGRLKPIVKTVDGSASLVNLAKLKKSPLHLPGMKKAHTAWFCVEHMVCPYLKTVSESARTLVKIGDEILPLLDPATIATWTTQLGGVKASLETFEKRFFSGDAPVSGFGEPLDWPNHTPKFNATSLAPDLISEMVAGSLILPSIPDDIKDLFHRDLHVCADSGGFLLASYLRGAIEDIEAFLEMLAEKR